MTAYNPAIVVLNNMLREQIRLVEQFVEINQRMYESYSSGLNNNYRYTTLEDTQQVYCLTIIPRARMGSEPTRPKAEWATDSETMKGERNNRFSKIQLAGQKYRDKTTLAS